ncbi:MAG: DUF3795 domain-containing protein [Anaerolineae bacterium]|nr:DUF3795 domain-containing protein [Anaerolineae bacterium]
MLRNIYGEDPSFYTLYLIVRSGDRDFYILQHKRKSMNIQYPELGICGLSCRLCPSYHIEGKSKCGGCKSDFRMQAGCPFITCALKKKGLEFCWQCEESVTCEKWSAHRNFSHEHDTFVCYQKLEDNVAAIKTDGIDAFTASQKERERLLLNMLYNYNEGRSKRYYCIAATVLEIAELQEALTRADTLSSGLPLKEKSQVLHTILDEVAVQQGYRLKLRK